MLRALVDLEALRVPNCGLGYYSLGLGRALLAEQNDELRLTYFLRRGQASYFERDDVELAFATNWRRETYCRALRPLLARVCREPYDVWHMANQNAKFWPLDRSTPLLLTIHDLNFLRERDPREHPHELAKLQKKVDRATALATDSQFVEREIRTHLDVQDKPISVVYCGANIAADVVPARPIFLPDRPLLFTIGEITPKKNFHVLLDLVERLPQHALVIAGNKSSEYAQQLETQVRERGLAERVFLPGQISGGERLWLYRHCEAFLFPSKTEGFGLPVIEAMSAGRPVFLSQATSLPEVGGPLGFYWHAYDAEHLLRVFQEGMQRVRCTPDYPQQLQRHAAQFTWERAAQQYAALYRQVAASTKSTRAA